MSSLETVRRPMPAAWSTTLAGRALIVAYGVVAYLAFFVVILYTIGFVSGFAVPKAINDGPVGGVAEAVVVNTCLMLLFVIQHTVMARPAFKRWITAYIPQAAERSTFVLLASACLGLVLWRWQPIPDVLWQAEHPLVRGVLHSISLLGWGIVFFSSFLIDHFDLFGLRQVVLHARSRPYTDHPFVVRSLYKFVRHPLMLGFVLAAWFTPDLTVGHVLFAGLLTAYILFGIRVEERDLLKAHGDDYRAYRDRTPALLPIPRRGN